MTDNNFQLALDKLNLDIFNVFINEVSKLTFLNVGSNSKSVDRIIKLWNCKTDVTFLDNS